MRTNGHANKALDEHIVQICDHYIPYQRLREGGHYTYPCPGCGEQDFEADPADGSAGCLDPDCSAPNSASAVGVISYFEGIALYGAGFEHCLRRGYDIAGIHPPDEDSREHATQNATATDCSGGIRSATEEEPGRWTAARQDGRHSCTASTATNPATEQRRNDPGASWTAAADQHREHARDLKRSPHRTASSEDGPTDNDVVGAWLHADDGAVIELGAYIVEPGQHDDGCHAAANGPASAEAHPNHWRPAGPAPTLSTPVHRSHEVYATLMDLCPLEDRDRRAFDEEGLIQDGTSLQLLGSISAKRCIYVTEVLRRTFGETRLLEVLGFYFSHATGGIAFALYGDYRLIAHLDTGGYIRTIEGRPANTPAVDPDGGRSTASKHHHAARQAEDGATKQRTGEHAHATDPTDTGHDWHKAAGYGPEEASARAASAHHPVPRSQPEDH